GFGNPPVSHPGRHRVSRAPCVLRSPRWRPNRAPLTHQKGDAGMSTATPVFTVQFAELTDALKTVAPAVAKRPRVAAVSGVLLESDGRDMIVTSNNFHESIVARVPDAVGAPGRMLVPHLEVTRTLKALVRGMSK